MFSTCALHFTGPPGSIEDDLGFLWPWKEDHSKDGENEADRQFSQMYYDFWSSYLNVLVRRRKRWEKTDPRAHPHLMQRFVHKGIPSTYRKEIWMRNCPPRGAPLSENVPDTVVDEIRLDLPRTFPDNVRLKDKRSRNALGRILYEVGKHLPSIGYCQGLNFIAAMLWIILGDEQKTIDLMIHLVGIVSAIKVIYVLFDPREDERQMHSQQLQETTFMNLQHKLQQNTLMLQIRPRADWYGSDMRGLRRDMKVMYEILRLECPVVCSTIDRLDIGLDILMGKWFVCWYVETLPMETVLRIWDCFIYEGDVWFFKIALRLLRANATHIAACRSLDEMLTLFQSIGQGKHALHCHRLIKVAKDEKVTQAQVDRLRRKYIDFS